MLYLHTGAHGSGKTTAFIAQIDACATAMQGNQFYLVPEVFTHEYQRLLAERTDNRIGRTAEVLSFTQLATIVFAQTGGAADTVLHHAGRLLTLQRAVQQIEGSLRHYRGLSDRPAVLEQVLGVVDELKTCCVTPEDLWSAVATLQEEQPRIADKLNDLAMIALTYDRLCTDQLPDPRDLLNRLVEALPRWQPPADLVIYLDGFRSFTAQQMQVIYALLGCRIPLHIALTHDQSQPDVTYSASNTFARLRKYATRHGIAWEEIAHTGVPNRPANLLTLAQSGLQTVPTQVTDDGIVHFAVAGDAYAACEHAAATILRIMEQTGAHWRDFAVVSPTPDHYEALLRIAMERFDIPIFTSQTTTISNRPPLQLVAHALTVATENFPLEALFTCLKTGLCNLTHAECDILEDYAMTWHIQGGNWCKPWVAHPKGYGFAVDATAQIQLDTLNQLRERAIAPFVALREGLRQTETAMGCVQALYAFLETQQTAEHIERRAQAHADHGQTQLAQEYRQLWEVLVSALEQCAWVCGDMEMTPARFAGLFTLVLSAYQVGTIPVSLDRVQCGAIARVCAFPVRYLLVLGCNDGSMPRVSEGVGVLSDTDRAYLEGAGVELTAYGEGRLGMELELLGDMLACPTEQLYFVHERTAPDGATVQPSYLLDIWRKQLLGAHQYACDPIADGLCAPRPRMALAYAAMGGLPDQRAQAVLLEQVLQGNITLPVVCTADSFCKRAYDTGLWVTLQVALHEHPIVPQSIATDSQQNIYENAQEAAYTALSQAIAVQNLPNTIEQAYVAGQQAGATILGGQQIEQYHSQSATIYQFGYLQQLQISLRTPPVAIGDHQKQLYGTPVRLTASRVDTYYHCPFSYFMQYGMQVQKRKRARFAAPEAGTFIHYVLEHLVMRLTADTTEAQAITWLREICEQYIEQELGGFADKTARFRTQFYRLRDSLTPVVQSMLEELQHTDFHPLDLELEFSPHGDLPAVTCTEGEVSVALSGKVDRVDGYLQGDRLYVRVMDYKSGKKSFSLSDLWYGLNLQLMIYLYALREDGLQRYCDQLGQTLNEIVPAGILYVPAREPVLEGAGMPDTQTLRNMRMDALRRSGLLLNDVEVLQAMEHGTVGKSKLFPFAIKEGDDADENTATGALATLAHFGRLAKYARKKLLDMGTQLQQGEAPAQPALQGANSPCDYCDYAAACHFDPIAGDCHRRLTPLSDGAVWEKIGTALAEGQPETQQTTAKEEAKHANMDK